MLLLELVDVSVIANEVASVITRREIAPSPRFHVDLEGAEVFMITAGIKRDELVALELAIDPERKQNPCVGERLGRDRFDIDLGVV